MSLYGELRERRKDNINLEVEKLRSQIPPGSGTTVYDLSLIRAYEDSRKAGSDKTSAWNFARYKMGKGITRW